MALFPTWQTHHQGPGVQQRVALCPHGGPGGQGQLPDEEAGTRPEHRGVHKHGAVRGAARHLHRGLGVAGGGPGPEPADPKTSNGGNDALGVGDGKWKPLNSWSEEGEKSIKSGQQPWPVPLPQSLTFLLLPLSVPVSSVAKDETCPNAYSLPDRLERIFEGIFKRVWGHLFDVLR